MTVKMYTRCSLIFVFCTCFTQLIHAQDTLAHWGFNEGAGSIAIENITQANFTINSKWPIVEWVQGVKQNAMRTDGYSVWAQGILPGNLPPASITISAWVAPEVYPVTNSAIWAQYEDATKTGAWIGLDKYGRLTVQFNKDGTDLSYTASASLSHYKWNYIVVNINAQAGTITGYLNALKVIDASYTPGGIVWPSSKTTLIGKYPKTEMNGLYNINTMNAIIDEVTLLRPTLDQATITQLYQQGIPSVGPTMKTPTTRFANDFLRPKYHPIPASNWCNESHGLIYHAGKYHMFYQKNGNGSYLFQQNWGHLISADLVTWEEVQVALWPQPGWDNYGVWSGHSILDQTNTPTIFYTGVDGVKAGIGKASPVLSNLTEWQKSVVNPVIPAAPSTLPNKDFRDCYIFKEGSTWYMIVGSGLQTPNVGNVFLYKSGDLNNWQYVGSAYQGNSAQYNSGVFWEMPVFWKFGGKYMLLVNKTPEANSPARAFYWVGNFANEIFTPDNTAAKNLDLINWLLSPSVNTDKDGIVTAIGIIPDLIPSAEQYKNGYANLFSLAREWNMQGNQLIQKPHSSLKKLRTDSVAFNNINITTTGSNFLGVNGFQKEIRASITADPQTQQAGIIIGKNPDGTEYTKIYYDYLYNEITIDRTSSSANPATPGDFKSAFFIPDDISAPMDWHIYIDGSVVEVFINDKYAFASRIYPASANSNQIDLFATGAAAVANVKVWNLDPLNVLPVTWVSFTSKKQNNAIQLQWKVDVQINNDHYEVQRSAEGINFYPIGELSADANGGNALTFIYTDFAPLTGNNYYRIKQVDRDGKVTYSVIRKETFSGDSKPYKSRLIQNPAKDFIKLFFKADTDASISLWDIVSRKILQTAKNNIFQNQIINIPVKGLSKGIYFLKVTGSDANETHKLIIE